MLKLFLTLLCSLLLSGCATTSTGASTAPSRPEVFIPGATPDQVKSIIIDRELSKGWQLAQDTTYQVSFTKQANNLGAIVLFGSQFNGIPNARARFTLTDSQGGTQVYLNGEMVSNPGSGFERSYPIEDSDKSAFPHMQKTLEEIKAQVLSSKSAKANR